MGVKKNYELGFLLSALQWLIKKKDASNCKAEEICSCKISSAVDKNLSERGARIGKECMQVVRTIKHRSVLHVNNVSD